MLEGWRKHRLGDLIDSRRPITYGVVQPGDHDPNGVPLVRGGDFAFGWRPIDQYRRISQAIDKTCARGRLKAGDLVITIKGDVGTSAIVPSFLEGANISQTNARLAIDPQKASAEFVLAFLQSRGGRKQIAAVTQVGAQPGLIFRDIQALRLYLPPLSEQHLIAAILRTWDEALEKLTAIRAAKRDRLIGLTQQTIGRGGVFPERWPLKALSAVSTPVRRKNAGDNHPVMTISAKSGFLMQSDKFARDMAGRSVERYTLLHEGEFAYNKGNSKTAPYGCVFRLDRPTALVPFVYYCFTLKPGLDPEFYEHLFAAGALNHQLSRLINSGVRNDGLLNLYSDDFYSCRVPVPPIDEQRQIARALTTAKQELALIDDEILALTRQKRGLMQKLLTGEWRVNSEKVLA